MSRIIQAAVGLALAISSVGCTDSVMSSNTRTSTISPKSTWQASGDLRNSNYAVDGDTSTAAVSANSYENARLTIDLGKPCVFNTIVIDHGARFENSYCRRLTVSISYDGRTYTQIYAAPGTRRVTYVNLITPTLARFIRFQAIVPGDRPWAVSEIYLQ